MSDMPQTEQQSDQAAKPPNAPPDVLDLPGVTDAAASPPQAVRIAVLSPDVGPPLGAASGVAQAADVQVAAPPVLTASDTSPPQNLHQSPSPRAEGLTAAEKLALLPPPDETSPYEEPVEVPIADIFDYQVSGHSPENRH